MELDQEFAWQGRRIAWASAGSGPAVVFCHGTPWSSWLWEPYAQALSDAFTVYLWDMPGYGRSSKEAAHAVDFDTQARVLVALVKHWGLERPHIVAHDIGGVVSLLAHLRHGARFASMLLADVVAIPPAGSPFYRYVRQHAAVLAELPPYIHEAAIRAYVSTASHRELREDDVAALAAPWLGPDGQPAFYRQITAFDELSLVEVEQRLDELDMPVRLVWGTEDTWLPIELGRRIASGLRSAEFVPVHGAGHLIQLDAPVALAAAVRSWLAR